MQMNGDEVTKGNKMRSIILSFVMVMVAVLSVPGSASAQKWRDFSKYTPANQEEKKIIEILAKWEKSINEKDADLHLSLFDKEALIVTRSGEQYKGEERINKMINSYIFPVVQSFKIEQVRVAIIRNIAKVNTKGVNGLGMSVSTKWVFEKREDGWIIKEELND
jgi:uncharacterized protein (TIGR02246 family)